MNDVTLDLLAKLLSALALGALIGAEREMKKAKEDPKSASFAGLRTHILVSLLGFCGALLSQSYTWAIVGVLLFGVILFFFGAYLNASQSGGRFGLAPGFSGVVTFLVGVMCLDHSLLAAVLAIATVLILALKHRLHHFIHSLTPSEFLSAIKFIIVAFVVLPVLPKEAIDPWGVFVPYHAWLMVVLVSSISFLGYILMKTLGAQRGLGLMAVLGGLASSTATTISLAQQGRSNKKLALALTSGVVTASMIMFIRALVEVSLVNALLVKELVWTLGAMIGTSLILLLILIVKLRHQWLTPKTKAPELQSPFRLWPALQFGALYVCILGLAEFANTYFGHRGVYVASLISGLADADAVVLSLSNLALNGKLAFSTAVNGITLAVMTNTVVKIGFVRVFGGKELFRWTALCLGVVVAVGLGAVILG